MDIERKNGTTLKGNSFTLIGPEIKSGQKAPEFTALAGDLSLVTLIKELRLLSRAIFIVGADDKVQYVEYVKDVASHPNYDAALNALKQGAHA
jgi:peroxiredoxin